MLLVSAARRPLARRRPTGRVRAAARPNLGPRTEAARSARRRALASPRAAYPSLLPLDRVARAIVAAYVALGEIRRRRGRVARAHPARGRHDPLRPDRPATPRERRCWRRRSRRRSAPALGQRYVVSRPIWPADRSAGSVGWRALTFRAAARHRLAPGALRPRHAQGPRDRLPRRVDAPTWPRASCCSPGARPLPAATNSRAPRRPARATSPAGACSGISPSSMGARSSVPGARRASVLAMARLPRRRAGVLLDTRAVAQGDV